MSFQNVVDYEPIGNNRFRQRNRLIEANSTNIIDTTEFPGLPNDCFKEKFKCSTKLALSLKNQLLAVITPSRELELYGLKEDSVVAKCRLRVLHDHHPEYCLLEWSSSQNLLLSTRSTAVLDVFESTGVFCFSIALGDDSFDARKIISQIRTTPGTDPETYDIAYILQLHSRFSVYKLGKGNLFEPLCTQKLGLPRSYCFTYVPSKHFLVVSTEYQAKNPVDESTKFTDVGLSLFEYHNQQIIKKVVPEEKASWTSWFPFFSERRAVVVSIDINPHEDQILAVTSRGDVLLFDFDLCLREVLSGEEVIPEAKFVQGIFTDDHEMAVLHKNGLIIQEEISLFFKNYLDGSLQGTIIQNCEKLFPSIKDEVFVLAEKEMTSSGALVSDNDYVNQFWFFTLFRLNFIYKWIKVLSGAAMGQPMEDVRAEYERLFQYSIYRVKTVSLLQYVRNLLAKKDYIDAEKLAETDEEFNMDLVFKQRWLDSGSEIDESLVNVLKKVKDKNWVVQECLSSKSMDSEVQGKLLDLAELAVAEIENPSLMEKVQNARLIYECLDEAPETFLKYRSMSVLEAALHFAEESNLEMLVKFVELYSEKLKNYIIVILSLIPEAIPVSKYERIFPWRSPGSGRKFFLEGTKFEETEIFPLEFLEQECFDYVISKADSDPVEFFVKWCTQRVNIIDNSTGLLENVTSLLHLAIDRGFSELKSTLTRFNFYNDFVVFSSAVALTFERFLSLDSGALRNAIIKHMEESQLQDEIVKIVELFEEFHPESASEDVIFIVQNFSGNNFGLLHTLFSVRPKYISKNLLIACFSESSLVGPPLICTMEKFNFEENISEALQICGDYGYEPKFSHLYEARASDELAEQIFLRFIKTAFKASEINYIMVLDSMKKIQKLLFDGLIENKKIINIFASELLSKLAIEKFFGFPFHLCIDTSSKDEKKLSMDEWQDLLLNKSLEFLDRAMPNQNDKSLILAREVLTLIPRDQSSSEKLKKQKDLVELTELCIELGSPRLPATFRFCEPELILQETTAINKNYKQVKKMAEVSKLLGLKSPVAKAMGYCTIEAVKADDYSTVEKYIKKLNSISKDMPVIFDVCKEILTTGKWKSLHEELLTCMVLNCPPDEIHLLSDFLKDFKKGPREEEERRSNSPASQVSATITKIRDNLVDPLLKSEKPRIIEDDELHLDPVYADIKYFHRLTKFPDIVPEGENLVDLAKKWAPISATLAVTTAVLDDEGVRSWAKNEFLNTIATGLRKIIEEGGDKLSVNVLEKIPTEVLLELGEDDFEEQQSEEEKVVKKPVVKEEPKVKKVEAPKVEKVEVPKVEKTKAPKVEKVETPIVEVPKINPREELEKTAVKSPEPMEKKKPVKIRTPQKQIQPKEEVQKKEVESPVVRRSPQPEVEEFRRNESESPVVRRSPQSEVEEVQSREMSFDSFSDSQSSVLRKRQKK
ncbi:hypothetical protein FO519_001876 [Halicephalobus sp. NKZ332]|nr:hypothetical protein FO519_001876 [Halicephalobus sp. NKZ332]